MKPTRLTALISLCVTPILMIACQGGGGSSAEYGTKSLDTFQDSVSYALGQDMGAWIVSQDMDLDMAAYTQGVADTLAGQGSLLAAGEAQRVMNAYRQQKNDEMRAQKEEEGKKNREAAEAFLAENGAREGVTTTESGLQYEVVKMGSGDKPAATNQVKVHYRGTKLDGSEFDSSHKRGTPSTFRLNGVISGWTEGLQLMPVGSTFNFYIPGDLAYGMGGSPSGGIGPDELLIFEVELIDILQ